MNGCDLIKEERERQIEIEGWTASHDDAHVNGELVFAAAHYALPEGYEYDMMETRAFWLNDTLFMLEWKPVVPYGWRNFAEFIQTLSDMELVALQKQARETDDKESLNLILVELGKRERNHAAAKETP